MKKSKRRPNTDAAKAEPIALWSLDTFFYAFIVGILFHWAALNYFSRTRFPEQRRRLKLSIAAGTGAAVLAALLQWFVMSAFI